MAYIHVPTLRYPLKERHIRQENPNTSFPKTFSAPEGYGLVQPSDQPEHDALTHKVKEDKPVLVDGVWTQQWSVVPLSEEEIGEINQNAARAARAERDRLLAETDWVVIKAYERSEVLPAEWQTYRQALRDVPAQEGFPHHVVWPEKP